MGKEIRRTDKKLIVCLSLGIRMSGVFDRQEVIG